MGEEGRQIGEPIFWTGGIRTKENPEGKEEVDATFVERDGKQYPAVTLPCAVHDRTRAGIRESGDPHFGGDELLQGDPVVTRAVTIFDQNTQKDVNVACVDLMVNFGSDKQGPVWKYVPNMRIKEDVPSGPGMSKKPFYFEGYDEAASIAINKGDFKPAEAEEKKKPVRRAKKTTE